MDIKIILGIIIVLLILDLVWIKLVVGNMWKKNVETVQKSDMKLNTLFASLSYIAIVFGLVYFVQRHITTENYVRESLINGFLFGVVLYAVFNFTNLALFKEYDIKTGVVDTLWGGVLCATTLLVVNFIGKK
jgi:uncharacterized membrane protein